MAASHDGLLGRRICEVTSTTVRCSDVRFTYPNPFLGSKKISVDAVVFGSVTLEVDVCRLKESDFIAYGCRHGKYLQEPM